MSSTLSEDNEQELVEIYKAEIMDQMEELNAQKRNAKSNGYKRPDKVSYWPFCKCSAHGSIRHTVLVFIHTSLFEYFILLTIVLNCIQMAIQSNIDPHWIWDHVEFAFQCIYTVEVILKVIAFGFVWE